MDKYPIFSPLLQVFVCLSNLKLKEGQNIRASLKKSSSYTGPIQLLSFLMTTAVRHSERVAITVTVPHRGVACIEFHLQTGLDSFTSPVLQLTPFCEKLKSKE